MGVNVGTVSAFVGTYSTTVDKVGAFCVWHPLIRNSFTCKTHQIRSFARAEECVGDAHAKERVGDAQCEERVVDAAWEPCE